ncbi:hypothetical protein [Tissierella pigra]|uniref:hypothetical protein n=1 Tax=Tissierella pigra TaxID=2607614 RepID=UPI0018A6BC87|nr:hypothetical protein [Tissierella pigra]
MNIHTKVNHKAKIKKIQLTFSFDLTNNFDMDDEVFLVHNIIEEMNLKFLDSAYSNKHKKYLQIKNIVFAYSKGKRRLEEQKKYEMLKE